MRPVLRRIHSPDIPDLRTFAPTASEPWCVYVQAMLGPDSGEGEESFGFTLCNHLWVSSQVKRSGSAWIGHSLVVEAFTFAILERAITSLCSSIEGKDWQTVARRLASRTDWEFTNYTP